MSPVAFAGTMPSPYDVSKNDARAARRSAREQTFIRGLAREKQTVRRWESSRSDLRIEVDRLGFPLLVKWAILGRNRQRIGDLNSQHDALGLRLHRRVGRRIDQLRRFQERPVRPEGEADLG